MTKLDLLPPGPGNARNSEGAFIELTDGRLLFVYTHFTGGGGDHDSAHLAGRFSDDGGRTWTSEDTMILPNEGDMNVMSVSLLRLQDGRIALFYIRKDSTKSLHLYMRTSEDEAKTWSEPTLCIPAEGYFVVNNDRVIQLRSGRLVAPTSLHNTAQGDWSVRGAVMCFLSDDNGRTWRQSMNQLEHPDPEGILQEPGVVELKENDRLMMLMRTSSGCQYRSWSADGGVTWSKPEPTDIISPVSPATVKRIPKTGDLLLVWNNHKDVDEIYRGKRTPLTAAVSRDEGKTWENIKTLEDDPGGWYCYTAMYFVDDRVVLGYCAGQRATGGLNLTRITTFDVDWLYR